MAQKMIPLTRDVYRYLLKRYDRVGKLVSDLLDHMNKYGLEPDDGTSIILPGECSRCIPLCISK